MYTRSRYCARYACNERTMSRLRFLQSNYLPLSCVPIVFSCTVHTVHSASCSSTRALRCTTCVWTECASDVYEFCFVIDLRVTRPYHEHCVGLTENDGHEIDGHEIDGTISVQAWNWRTWKYRTWNWRTDYAWLLKRWRKFVQGMYSGSGISMNWYGTFSPHT